jgi:molecular chaperone DnaK (HSP70)
MKPISGGIDFGTSNSTVGFVENGSPRLVAVELPITPRTSKAASYVP